MTNYPVQQAASHRWYCKSGCGTFDLYSGSRRLQASQWPVLPLRGLQGLWCVSYLD